MKFVFNHSLKKKVTLANPGYETNVGFVLRSVYRNVYYSDWLYHEFKLDLDIYYSVTNG